MQFAEINGLISRLDFRQTNVDSVRPLSANFSKEVHPVVIVSAVDSLRI